MTDKRKPPRSARRYFYECLGQLSLGNELDDTRLTNISASGIQFETANRIQLNVQINLLWNDPALGMLSSSMFVVREVHRPEREKYQFIYGAQYHNLDPDIKTKLVLVLKRLKDQETLEALEKVQEASPDHVLEVAKNGRKYLKKLLSGEETLLPAFAKALEHLADYEKKSFQKNDEISGTIQDLCTQTFQCEVLSSIIPIISKHPELKLKYFHTVTSVVQKIRETMDNNKDLIHEMEKLEESDPSDKLIEAVQESKNRIFYSQQKLLQLVYDSFHSVDGKNPELQASLKIITSEYEHTLEVTNSSGFDLATWGIMKKEDLPKVMGEEVIVDNRPIPGQTSSTITQTLLFIALTGVLILLFERLF